MGQLTDQVLNLLDRSEAKTIIAAIDGQPDAVADRVNRELAAKDPDHARDLVLAILANGIEKVLGEVKKTNGSVAKLRSEHDAVMRGEGTGCRHLANMENRALKYLLVAIAAPIVVSIIIGVAVFALTRG